MTQTIHIERVKGTPTTATDVVHSPDDGGYYLSQVAFLHDKTRVSVKIYATSYAATMAYTNGRVKWEPWS